MDFVNSNDPVVAADDALVARTAGVRSPNDGMDGVDEAENPSRQTDSSQCIV